MAEYRALVADRSRAIRHRRRVRWSGAVGVVVALGLSAGLVAAGAHGQGSATSAARPTTGPTATTTPSHAGTAPGTAPLFQQGRSSSAGSATAAEAGCPPGVSSPTNRCIADLAGLAAARAHGVTLAPQGRLVVSLTRAPQRRWGVPQLGRSSPGVLVAVRAPRAGQATFSAGSPGTVTVLVPCSGSGCPAPSTSFRVRVAG